MKAKVLSVFLISAIILMLVACNTQPQASSDPEPKEKEISQTQVEEEIAEEPEEEPEIDEPNPIDVAYIGEGLKDDEIENYFRTDIFPYLEKQYDRTFTDVEVILGIIFVTFDTPNTEKNDISLESWKILNDLILFEPFKHTFYIHSESVDGNIWISQTLLEEAEKISNGSFIFIDWHSSHIFMQGDGSEQDIAYKDRVENLKVIQGLMEEDEGKTEEEVIEEFNREAWFEEYKEAVNNLVEAFDGELTKIVYGEGDIVVVVVYNTKWSVEDTIKKELFDMTKSFTQESFFEDTNLEITATSKRADSYKAYTTYESILKLQNLEMSYDDWVGEAF